MKHISIGLILILLSSCKEKGQFLDKKYEGFWAGTYWTYEFKKNGRFIFKSEGHYGNVEDSGFYFVGDSLILLNPSTDFYALDEALKTRLKIINNSCIRDFDSNYYCVVVDTIVRLSELELTFQNRVIEIVDTLQIVKDEKERVASYYHDKEELKFKVMYDGIIVIDNLEFHSFNLYRYDLIEEQKYYLTFLATKKPFEIFQLNGNSTNRLSLIYTK
ncbi:MAG: hypothetical protein HOP08_17095 [Cyclobacteriaceae bacterium]|nr:hypothetical protein [Cyclobacteriaceae bacterium]